MAGRRAAQNLFIFRGIPLQADKEKETETQREKLP